MDIDTYVMSETLRQSGTLAEAQGMKRALENIAEFDFYEALIAIQSTSLSIKGTTAYRRTPVTFANGGFSVEPDLIPNCMANLTNFIGKYAIRSDKTNGFIDTDVDLIVKEFLIIHPFADGNGRVASVLRNWLLGTLSDPTPLPYYFGDN